MKRTALAAVLALALAGPTAADTPSPGEIEYRTYCQTCHGADGRGDGPMAGVLSVGVPDLTRIAARNDGVFPLERVFGIVDGRGGLRAHGGPMPVWGDRFTAEAEDHRAYWPFGSEIVVRARILELVYYLQGLQE